MLWWAQDPFAWHCTTLLYRGLIYVLRFFQSGVSPSFCSTASEQLSAAGVCCGRHLGEAVSSRRARFWRKLPSHMAAQELWLLLLQGQLGTSAVLLLWLPRSCVPVCWVFVWVQARALESHRGAHPENQLLLRSLSGGFDHLRWLRVSMSLLRENFQDAQQT